MQFPDHYNLILSKLLGIDRLKHLPGLQNLLGLQNMINGFVKVDQDLPTKYAHLKTNCEIKISLSES